MNVNPPLIGCCTSAAGVALSLRVEELSSVMSLLFTENRKLKNANKKLSNDKGRLQRKSAWFERQRDSPTVAAGYDYTELDKTNTDGLEHATSEDLRPSDFFQTPKCAKALRLRPIQFPCDSD